MLSRALQRAKRFGLPFDLTEDDIEIPEVCPVLGVPLQRGHLDYAPSLDRTIPERGYVRGNVIVVSALVNRIKSNATADQILKTGFWLALDTDV